MAVIGGLMYFYLRVYRGMQNPHGLDVDDETGNIFVADTGNDRVQESWDNPEVAQLTKLW